jgi:hypothetical protein
MTRLILAAGVAALAITSPAASQPGDRGGDRRAEVQKKRGEARAQRTERRDQRAQRVDRRADRVERRAERPQRAERVREQRVQRVDRRADRVERRAERPQQMERVREQRAQRVERVPEQRAQRVDRAREQRFDRQRLAQQRMDARDRQIERIAARDDRRVVPLDQRREMQIQRIANREDRRLARLAETRIIPAREWNDLARGGVWLNGCPPGLAKKPVACVPPGQVANVVGQRLSILGNRVMLQDVPNRLRYVYADTPDYYYRYGNGYIYQVDRSDDLIMALLPLFGLGLTVGQPFPAAYSNYYMPVGLQPFYANSACGYSPYGYSPLGFTSYDNDYYRYANGYVYEIDCRTGLIEDVDPLLGYGYGYGQMMPVTYSAYNVPYQYRPLYYDTSDYYYRYAPGAIYQVDPTTSLITAVAALLTGGMTVGQPLPTGYGVYNVPYAYRTTYYDTPNAWYRYSNGYIYRVDPATQLVTAIVASALT